MNKNVLRKILRSFRQHISAFDIGILVVGFICLLVFFLFFYRKSETITIRVKVTDQDVLYQRTEPTMWYANRFFVGDKELDALGRTITEIVGIDMFPVDSKHKAVYLDLKVKAVYDTRTKTYSTHGKTLMFGTPMRFNVSKVTFDGFVTEFPGSEKDAGVKIGKATVKALARNLEPSIASAITPGSKILDSNQLLLAEITDVTVTPAEKVTTTDAGDLLLRYDPLYKDALITVDIRTKTVGKDVYIFDNLPLKIGEPLPLHLENVSVPSNIDNRGIPSNLDTKNIFPIIVNFTPVPVPT
ncbi:MAG: hypothetical protein UV63_C0012G0010 [Microgenomates group bacterium GW2011_GWC1_43_11]|uniref:Uncharacterized protein n=1 Tax=Candidatus Gottesmanbacteria bacterium GW2011_GWB1_44_11c TaxID=1618447 RepID=A0A0G1JQA7_9BACT|nr:MAG: hypothetical protein UV63_C0012G0010 [Microgenomates group bacterium GW2011_GWC1_43_11]KKT37599.1 MAG: hypothetical protein UW22_C0022G0004 [Candidatus Gottesmanbacteria bacterium GW2011_GWB1_44_11c]